MFEQFGVRLQGNYTSAHNPTPLRKHHRSLWQKIYRAVLPDFDQMDSLTKYYRTGVLRRNVKA